MLRIVISVSLLLTVLTACTSGTLPRPISNEAGGAIPGVKEAQEKSGEPWQIKWDKVVREAKKEGKVVVYGAATGQIREALIKAFDTKYGIAVEYLAVKGPEIAAKLTAERTAGLYLPDAIIGASGPAVTTLKPAGVFDPMAPVLILPEVMDPKVWWENRLPWVDKEHYLVAFLAYAANSIVINADMVRPEEMKSYRDLLGPKSKGKVVMRDPTIAGAGKMFIDVQAHNIMGLEYLRQLAGQEPFIARDHRLLAEWVARGKYPIGLPLKTRAFSR